METRQVGHRTRTGHFGRAGLALMLAVLLSFGHPWPPPVAHAGTFTVNSTLDEPDARPGDGFCKSTPSAACTLRAAIEEANATTATDTINVPVGTFTLPLDELRVTSSMRISGGGTAGTILEAATDPSQARHRVLNVWHPSENLINVTVSGLTVRHGALFPSNFGALDTSGGGILVGPGATLRLESVLVNRNQAMAPLSTGFVGFGGGIALVGAGALELFKSAVNGNHAASMGGGIHCNFFSAAAEPRYLISDSSVVANSSDRRVGGIDTHGRCSGTIERSTVASNRATQAVGGLSLGGGVHQILTSTIASNSLNEQGAAGVTGRAGGITIASSAAQVTLKSVTLANNVAAVNDSGSDVAHNLTIYGSAAVSLANTVVAHSSTAGKNCAIVPIFGSSQTIPSLGGNIEFPGRTCGLTRTASAAAPDRINVDPRLGALASNGGSTQTMALQAGSPAIDLIPSSACLTIDQRGLPRPRDGNGDGTAACDSGAFEVQSPPVGTFSLAPSTANVAVGQRHPAVLTWVVPAPESWRTLKWVQVRLRETGREDDGRAPNGSGEGGKADAAHVALQFQWDEDANTVRQVDPKTGQLGPPAALGSDTVLDSPRAALYLKESSIKGGGPNVGFTISLALKPPTKGRTYSVEVAAANDGGASQEFAAAGTISVERFPRN